MKLYEAINKVIVELGIDIFKSSIVVNVLADYGAYNDTPAIKQILKDLVAQGYGNDIISICSSVDNQTNIKLQSLKAKFIQQTGYKDDLVGYLFDSIQYAIGTSKDIPQYHAANREYEVPTSNARGKISDFNKELLQLQSDYIDSLNKLYEQPDVDSLAPCGFYSAEATSQLWLIEQKIILVYKALGQEYNDWCKSQKVKYLDSKTKNRRAILTEKLEAVKKNYISLLTSLITIPKNIIYAKSGYYNDAAIKTLEAEEIIIGKLDKSLGTNELQHCLNEKQKILDRHKQSFSKQLLLVVLKVILPICVVSSSLYYGVTYISSQEEIEVFDNYISSADQLMADHAYIEAISMYDKAYVEYNGAFDTDGYKSRALAKKEYVCSLLLNQKITSSVDYYNKGNYKQSVTELESIKAYMVTPNLSSTYDSELEKLNKQIQSAIKRDMNTIILNISSNKGKLDSIGKNMLNALLEVAPNNHWLNIIKKKQKL